MSITIQREPTIPSLDVQKQGLIYTLVFVDGKFITGIQTQNLPDLNVKVPRILEKSSDLF